MYLLKRLTNEINVFFPLEAGFNGAVGIYRDNMVEEN